MKVLFVLLLFWSAAAARKLCDVCNCHSGTYYYEQRNISDCNSRKLTITNITLLETLSDNVEVLLLSNNDLPTLPVNLFGSEKNLTNLQIIDMSRNNISDIKGKTFHHVPNVEMLILDHNSISSYSHPRIFSNLENLKELHLTNAFRNYELLNFTSHLEELFTNSSLIKLEKLHLEQNEIRSFSSETVFCSLEHLMDLHLGNNLLNDIQFRIDCLFHLRFIDFDANTIQAFTKDQLDRFDALPARNQSLMIDISNNPLACDCKLYEWVQSSKVTVRNDSNLQCHYFDNGNGKMLLKNYYQSSCNQVASVVPDTDHTTHRLANITMLAILCGLIVVLFYISARYSVDYFKHSGVSSSKVHYVVIQNYDDNRDVARV